VETDLTTKALVLKARDQDSTTTAVKDPVSIRPLLVETVTQVKAVLADLVAAVDSAATRAKTLVATEVLDRTRKAAELEISEVHSPLEEVPRDLLATATISRWVETLVGVTMTTTASTNNSQPSAGTAEAA
jgi:hypothetical protein